MSKQGSTTIVLQGSAQEHQQTRFFGSSRTTVFTPEDVASNRNLTEIEFAKSNLSVTRLNLFCIDTAQDYGLIQEINKLLELNDRKWSSLLLRNLQLNRNDKENDNKRKNLAYWLSKFERVWIYGINRQQHQLQDQQTSAPTSDMFWNELHIGLQNNNVLKSLRFGSAKSISMHDLSFLAASSDLSSSPTCKLSEVTFSRCGFESLGCFGQFASCFPSIQRLMFVSCEILVQNVSIMDILVQKGFIGPQIQHLTLHNLRGVCGYDHTKDKSFMNDDAFQSTIYPQVTTLEIENAAMTDGDLLVLVHLLQAGHYFPNLVKLSLSYNKFSDIGAIKLANYYKTYVNKDKGSNRSIQRQWLDLSRNKHITATTWKHFVEALVENVNLEQVSSRNMEYKHDYQRMLYHWMDCNRGGRRALKAATATRLSLSLWPKILERAQTQFQNDKYAHIRIVNVMYYLIRESNILLHATQSQK